MTPDSVGADLAAELGKPAGVRDVNRVGVLRRTLAGLHGHDSSRWLWEPAEIAVVADLRSQLEQARRLGYRRWQVHVRGVFACHPQHGGWQVLQPGRRYLVCEVDDPDLGDPDAGILDLLVDEAPPVSGRAASDLLPGRTVPAGTALTVEGLCGLLERAERGGHGRLPVCVVPVFDPDPAAGGRHVLRATRYYPVCGVDVTAGGSAAGSVLVLWFGEVPLECEPPLLAPDRPGTGCPQVT